MADALSLPPQIGSKRGSPTVEPCDKRRHLSQTHAAVADSISRTSYRAGAIVRVTVKNFVTYTEATFHTGPSLNLILGPNGTGKSTLVCAINLGLGFPASVLGRSKDSGEYIKHGCSKATIEIELQGKEGLHNPVITREIEHDSSTKSGSSSLYYVDGDRRSQKDIRTLIAQFNIQCDNLCQFLPQDRVVEFSALDPVELLVQTERAAAGSEMADMHQELSKLSGHQHELFLRQKHFLGELKNLNERQAAQEEDVARMRERDNVENQVRTLESLKPFAELNKIKRLRRNAKLRKRRCQQALESDREQMRPFHDELRRRKDYMARCDNYQHHCRIQLKNAQNRATELGKSFGDLQTEIEDCDREHEAENSSAKKRIQETQELKRRLEALNKQLAEGEPEFDPSTYNRTLRELQARETDLQNEASEADSSRGQCKDQIRRLQTDMRRLEDELRNLDTQAGRREQLLRQNFSEVTLKFWKWVQENRHHFDGEVFGPAILVCNMTDTKFAAQIESCMRRVDWLAITCTNINDFRKLNSALQQQGNAETPIRCVMANSSDFVSPFDSTKMAQLGLDGMAIDFIEGPEPVLAMLCSERHLHQTGIAAKNLPPAVIDALIKSSVRNFACGDVFYATSKRPEISQTASSTSTNDIRPAMVWTSQAFNVAHLKEECQVKINELQAKAEELTFEANELNKTSRDKREEISEVKRQIKQTENDKRENQKAKSMYQGLPFKKQSIISNLARFEVEDANLMQKVYSIFCKRFKCNLKRGETAIELSETWCDIQDFHRLLAASMIQLNEAKNDVCQCETNHADLQKQFAEHENELRQASQDFDKLDQLGKQLLAQCNSTLEQDEELTDFYTSMSDEDKRREPEELDREITTSRARLELLPAGDLILLREHEERKRRIAHSDETLNSTQRELAAVTQELNDLRNNWEPRLEEMIKSISRTFGACFDRIGCEGEVGLRKSGRASFQSGGPVFGVAIGSSEMSDEVPGIPFDDDCDFSKWAIEIRVSFRKGDPTTILDNHSQSGGERSVSTIFYLMALQALSTAPFRVVDEINQGMDPRNERSVHAEMVNMACGVGAEASQVSQYFLVTPKLLTGLHYVNGMDVRIIYSGLFVNDLSETDERDGAEYTLSMAHLSQLARSHTNL